MVKKPLMILTAASLLVSASAEAVMAQSYYGGRGSSYGDGYTDGYRAGWDDFRMKREFNDRAPRGGGAPQYLPGADYSRYNGDPRMGGDPDQRWRQRYQRQYTYQ